MDHLHTHGTPGRVSTRGADGVWERVRATMRSPGVLGRGGSLKGLSSACTVPGTSLCCA